MSKSTKIKGTATNWENGKLGCDEQFMVAATPEEELVLDRALDLKPISIRMPTELIRKMKLIANFHGIGYQPLMRDVLSRFAGAEMVDILRQVQDQKALEAVLSDEDSPAARQMKRKYA